MNTEPAARTPISWQTSVRSAMLIAAAGAGTSSATLPEPRDHEWAAIVAAARYHGLIGEVGRCATANQWELPPATRQQVHTQTMRAMRRLIVTETTLAVLTRSGIDALTFKGLALAAETRPDPFIRTSTDVDVLIAPDALNDAVRALRLTGATIVPGYPEPDDSRPFRLYRRMRHELTLSLRGVHVDLHWRLGLDRSLMPTAEVALSRARDVAVGGTQLRTLNPQDTLLHSCLHWNSDKHPRLKNALDIAILDNLVEPSTAWTERRSSRTQSELVRIARVLVTGDFPGAAETADTSRGRRLVRGTLTPPREMPILEERVRSFAHHMTAPPAWQDRAAHPARLTSRLLLEQHRRFSRDH